MSYILEALKKAQAERQLGSTPGIHDVLAPSVPAPAAAAPVRYWIAGGAATLAAVAFLSWRMFSPVAPGAPAPVQLVKAEPPAAVAEPAAPPPVAAVAPAPVVKRAAVEPPASLPPVSAPPAPPPVQPAPEPDADDALPALAALPPSVQGTIPKITLGGYIYSPVPAERLLLIDNNLRREGEEVAAGLVLERLLPRAAVMNYRGTRFRMPY